MSQRGVPFELKRRALVPMHDATESINASSGQRYHPTWGIRQFSGRAPPRARPSSFPLIELPIPSPPHPSPRLYFHACFFFFFRQAPIRAGLKPVMYPVMANAVIAVNWDKFLLSAQVKNPFAKHLCVAYAAGLLGLCVKSTSQAASRDHFKALAPPLHLLARCLLRP